MSEFSGALNKVQLSNGEEIELPRLTIRKILQVSNSVANLVKATREKHPQLFEEVGKSPENVGSKVIAAIPELIPDVLDEVSNLLATYLGKEKKWIDDNLDLEDVVKVVAPFFVAILKQGNALVETFNSAVGGPSNK